MQWFHQLRIMVKLVISFLIVAAIGAAIGALGIFHMSRINAATENLYSQDVRALKGVQEATIHLIYASRAQMNLLAASTMGERSAGTKAIQAAMQGLDARMAEVRPLLEASPEGQALYKQYEDKMPRFKEQLGGFVTLLLKQSLDSSQFEGRVTDDSIALMKESRGIEEVLNRMVERSDQLARASMEKVGETYKASRLIMLALVLSGIVASVGLGVAIARLLGRQIGGEPAYASDIVGRVAAGDLAVPIQIRRGDTRSLLYAIEQMQQELARVIDRIRQGTDTIATASSQIAAGNHDLSSRTEQQASSLEETAASMEEL
ncbi:MCP four helix bundle domain-containing protein, partial [Polaromonas sp.]|uniref:MCP four helix bundle domain-containing protein n=1 Tax=Polaromonas sp. TaxID=1869339 RepID=UPI003CA79D60